ncbi:MAG: hypothetical protein VW226_10375 [Rhodospirillaceae bacterium]
MMYCPAWIYAIICNEICKNYVTSELDISAFAKKYASKAEQTFPDLDASKLAAGAEAIVRFLGTVEGVDVIQVCNAFTYNTALFERDGSPRKGKGLFGKNDVEGVKLEALDEDAEKLFRTFAFRLRSNPKLLAPEGWSLRSVEGLKWVADAVEQEVSFIDSLG